MIACLFLAGPGLVVAAIFAPFLVAEQVRLNRKVM
jgi:hypothetical protein